MPDDPKIIVRICFGSFWVVIRCCPMADSQLILALLFLHRRGGCSLTVLFFS